MAERMEGKTNRGKKLGVGVLIGSIGVVTAAGLFGASSEATDTLPKFVLEGTVNDGETPVKIGALSVVHCDDLGMYQSEIRLVTKITTQRGDDTLSRSTVETYPTTESCDTATARIAENLEPLAANVAQGIVVEVQGAEGDLFGDGTVARSHSVQAEIARAQADGAPVFAIGGAPI